MEPKTVKVKCQATQENPLGFYMVNESDVVEGMEVIPDETEEAKPETEEAKPETSGTLHRRK